MPDDEAYETMKIAWDNGCNYFDTAEVYNEGKAEVTMGKCIKRLALDRSLLVISTKVFWGGKGVNQTGLSRKHVIEGVTACLRRLQLEYVDVVFAHRPDPDTPMEETVRAFDWCINKGLAFYWGTSEWSADQIMEATHIAKTLGLIAPVVEQPQYSMLHRTQFELGYHRIFKELGYGTTIWSPLASGLLTGKYTSGSFPKDSRLGNVEWLRKQLMSGNGINGLEEKNLDVLLRKVESLQPIAKSLNCSLSQLAIAWCVMNRNVSTVILGASKTSQLVENFAAMAVVPKMTPEVMAQIDTVLQNKPAAPRNWK